MILYTEDVYDDGLIKPDAEFKLFISVDMLKTYLARMNKPVIDVVKGDFCTFWKFMDNPSVDDVENLNNLVFGTGIKIQGDNGNGGQRMIPVETVYVPVYKSSEIPIKPDFDNPKDLRDEFAIAALPAAIELFDRRFSDPNKKTSDDIAAYAYQTADAMMERRKK